MDQINSKKHNNKPIMCCKGSECHYRTRDANVQMGTHWMTWASQACAVTTFNFAKTWATHILLLIFDFQFIQGWLKTFWCLRWKNLNANCSRWSIWAQIHWEAHSASALGKLLFVSMWLAENRNATNFLCSRVSSVSYLGWHLRPHLGLWPLYSFEIHTLELLTQ